MDVFEAVRTVLAVRQFQDRAIDEAIVREIVEAARLTGSSINGQPWHFIVVQNRETLRKLGAIAWTGPYTAQAPLAIVVGMEHSVYAVSDGSRAIQSMILTAWSHGIGSNWVGFNDLAEIRPLLGIPNSIDVLAIVPFGYPVRTLGKGRKNRKLLSEAAHNEHWEQPFD